MEGGGAHDGTHCYSYTYSEEDKQGRHISQLEAINVMAAVRALITENHRGQTVLVRCDNQSAVAVYTAGRGIDQVILACARALWRHAADCDVNLVFKHTPGVDMTTADILSRVPLSPGAAAAARDLIRNLGLIEIAPEPDWFKYFSFL